MLIVSPTLNPESLKSPAKSASVIVYTRNTLYPGISVTPSLSGSVLPTAFSFRVLPFESNQYVSGLICSGVFLYVFTTWTLPSESFVVLVDTIVYPGMSSPSLSGNSPSAFGFNLLPASSTHTVSFVGSLTGSTGVSFLV